MKKKLLVLTLIFMLSVNVVFGAQIYKSINVLVNDVQVFVNGSKVNSDNFVYNGTTYVPLKTVSNMLGAQVTWDSATRNINITTDTQVDVPLVINRTINAFKPTISLNELGISNIEAISVVTNGEPASVQFQIENGNLILSSASTSYGGYPLNINTNYTMKLYFASGSKTVEFKTGDLRVISQTDNATVYYVPAIPSKGFNWPYLLRIPGKNEVFSTYASKMGKTLMIETANFGTVDSLSQFENELQQLYFSYLSGSYYSIDVSKSLNLPSILPILPRYHAYYQNGDATHYLYTHSLDRDTAIFNELLENPLTNTELTHQFTSAGFNINDFKDLDLQVIKMADHARSYLSKNNIQINDKYFMYGYSASGTFSDRLVSLYPEKFRAYASGATLDDMVLPTASYKGKNLIFPIGVYDYKSITGKDFNLSSFNQVARLIHMGSEDDNNTLNYADCYGDDERKIIKSLFAEDVKTRANQLMSAYKEVGGKGIFILDQGIGHSLSNQMKDYLITFFETNLTGSAPVYTIPKDTKQLVYTLYK